MPVTVVTAASGQLRDHPDERDGEERGSHPVPGERPCWSGQLEGLLLRPVRQPSMYGELTSDSFALKDGDAVYRHCLRHRDLRPDLQQGTAGPAAGYKQDDIKGFADLKKVADDIQARKD